MNDSNPPWHPSPKPLSESEFVAAHQAMTAKGLIVTPALIGIFVACYLGSLYLSYSLTGHFDLTPNPAALFIMGAMRAQEINLQGEWYRLLTATVLHGNVLHIAMNSYALLMVGRFLEPLVGKFWFFALFTLGGLGGSLLGYKINEPDVTSVGASGAIMGLFAVMGICSLRVPAGTLRNALRIDAVQVLIPSLIPLGISIGGAKIDYAAHLGGAVAGIVAGLVCIQFWSTQDLGPRTTAVTKLFALLCLSAYLIAGGDAAVHGKKQFGEINEAIVLEKLVVPNELYKKLKIDDEKSVAEMLASYPRDPRLLWLRASFLIRDQKWKEGEKVLRDSLKEKRTLELFFPKAMLTERITLTLVHILVFQKREEEARQLVRPLCGEETKSLIPREYLPYCK